MRWLAYLARVKAIAARAGTISLKVGPARYFAFTSDVGEAFRPAVPKWLVNSSYGISVAYIGGAIIEAGYAAKRDGKPPRAVVETVAEEATFQFLASLLLPFLFIHTAVHKSAVVLKSRSVHLTRPMLARWGPSAVGLACIPLLPTLVDKPCEYAVETFFHRYVHQDQSWAAGDFNRYHQESKHFEGVRQKLHHDDKKVE